VPAYISQYLEVLGNIYLVDDCFDSRSKECFASVGHGVFPLLDKLFRLLDSGAAGTPNPGLDAFAFGITR